MDFYFQTSDQDSIPLELHTKSGYDQLLDKAADNTSRWLLTSKRTVKEGAHYLVPNERGELSKVIIIVKDELSIWSVASLPLKLPPGDYHLSNVNSSSDRELLSLGWGMGAYQFTDYRQGDEAARLRVDADINLERIKSILNATFLARNLVNAPANDMLPSHLAAATKELANDYGADFVEIRGDELLEQNYPLIHAVGRASTDEPRLLKLTWGDESHPLVGIVGKGVCFDSGGLDIKPASGMRWMKKDMGGAAHALGVASFIMANRLPVCLKVFIPAVENAVAGNAFRPGDVIRSRAGKTVEIDNTDAEGRLVMADALSELGALNPDLLIDYSTLTGAARVALGTEVGVFFSRLNQTSHDLYKAASQVEDDIWRLPLHNSYKHQLKSSIADLVNCASSGYGGAITAALFLGEFVDQDCDWVHFDIMAYNMRSRPGRPKGGEAMGLRSVCHFLESRYA